MTLLAVEIDPPKVLEWTRRGTAGWEGDYPGNGGDFICSCFCLAVYSIVWHYVARNGEDDLYVRRDGNVSMNSGGDSEIHD